ncbi:YpmS family protein [Anoxybacillus rupiensis]|jgi:uncharacterized protein YpmS|uniref:YpmS family protein n=1 Tax=Anoxybacteroides rupiense TaxID=311460 RepID=A0ABT5W4G1_9BACL|nr:MULTISPECIES: YpmS family protein [Anoxybacillus]MBS2772576.1 YpmS family protein [Anoxybacillus rupiensis]MDE8564087.1 YpmS family protein [Anoxybacillus rupiensis]OQM45864.1 hypothetical protein B6A27_09410 [Anoxybacillus sp. UARK-01]QHC03999.1 DUF2140 family protein [Anoxybacillus sp. PDR2]
MKWKVAFFGLLAINMVIVVSLLCLILQPSSTKLPTPKAVKGATFLVHSSKEDVNILLNDYLKEKTKNSSLSYRVWIDDRVYVASQVPLFSRNVDLTVSFVPKIVKGGNLELRDPDLSLGEWQLPVNYTLSYLQKHAKLPDEVMIEPDAHRIYIDLANIQLKNGYRITAKEFDLEHDKIVFALTVPVK